MSSKILSVSEKTRRQFLEQKITYSDQSRVGSLLEKSSVFQAIFYCWRQSEWFQIQREFATPFEEMSPPELNKCLQKFYLSARKRDGSFYNKKSLTAIRAALDRHLRSPPFSKPFSIVGDSQFNDANTSLSNFLKILSKSGQIAPTMHDVNDHLMYHVTSCAACCLSPFRARKYWNRCWNV